MDHKLTSPFINTTTVTHPNPLEVAFQSIPSYVIPEDRKLFPTTKIPELDLEGIRTITLNPFLECPTIQF